MIHLLFSMGAQDVFHIGGGRCHWGPLVFHSVFDGSPALFPCSLFLSSTGLDLSSIGRALVSMGRSLFSILVFHGGSCYQGNPTSSPCALPPLFSIGARSCFPSASERAILDLGLHSSPWGRTLDFSGSSLISVFPGFWVHVFHCGGSVSHGARSLYSFAAKSL